MWNNDKKVSLTKICKENKILRDRLKHKRKQLEEVLEKDEDHGQELARNMLKELTRVGTN